MALVIRPAYDSPQEIRALFSEYTQMLVEADPGFRKYLDLQGYEQELARPEDKYARPRGRLFLAEWEGRTAGCAALRPLDPARCELKRLYVRPVFRGRGIGRALTERMLREAQAAGYRAMLLDTLPCLESALRLYRALGFREIPCYNNSPVEATIFMQRELNDL